jgi:putative transposase
MKVSRGSDKHYTLVIYIVIHINMKYLSTGNAVYDLKYHLVIVTKYRRKILTKEMIGDIKELVSNILSNILSNNKNSLIELNGEEDHIHMIIELKPTAQLPKIINTIKTVSSRILRKKYNLKSLVRNKNILWSPSYFITTCGNTTIDVLKNM